VDTLNFYTLGFKMNIYKKWLLKTSLLTTVFFLGTMFFNYKVDTAGIFSSNSCLRSAASAMANGNIVAGLGDEAFDGRLFQILFIKEINKKVDTIALGSSRTKELRSRYLNNSSSNFYNHSINGSSLQDYIAIVGAYKKIKGYIPKEIIIGIDPWVFNENSGRNRWKNISGYYDFMKQEISGEEMQTDKLFFSVNKLKQLLNYDYTITNIKYLYQRLRKRDNGFYIVDTLETDDFLREPDGSIHYPFSVRNPNKEKLLIKSKNYALGNVYSLENYHKIAFKKEFDTFMKYLRQKGVKVTIFLPPYNPIPYDILKKQKKYKIDGVERYLRMYAKHNKLDLIGSYNPHTLNLVMTDFFDGMHVNSNSIKQMFNKYNDK